MRRVLRFQINLKNHRPSDREIVADLRRWARRCGRRAFSYAAYRERGRFGANTVARRFGSWNAALAAAKLPVRIDRDVGDRALFENLANHNINVDMIVQNASKEGLTDISFTVPKADMKTAEQIVARVATEVGAQAVTHDADIAKISLVGAGMKTSPGIAAKMFRVLADNNVNIQMISTSTIRVSVVVAASDMEKAVRSLHTAFGLDSGSAYSAPLPERK